MRACSANRVKRWPLLIIRRVGLAVVRDHSGLTTVIKLRLVYISDNLTNQVAIFQLVMRLFNNPSPAISISLI